MSDPITLLPCPFCGCKALYNEGCEFDKYIRCVDCGSRGPSEDLGKGAVVAWNKRILTTATELKTPKSYPSLIMGCRIDTKNKMIYMKPGSVILGCVINGGSGINLCAEDPGDIVIEGLIEIEPSDRSVKVSTTPQSRDSVGSNPTDHTTSSKEIKFVADKNLPLDAFRFSFDEMDAPDPTKHRTNMPGEFGRSPREIWIGEIELENIKIMDGGHHHAKVSSKKTDYCDVLFREVLE